MSQFLSFLKFDQSSSAQGKRVESEPSLSDTPRTQAQRWGSHLFQFKQKKKDQTDLDRMMTEWKQFRINLDKIIMDPQRYQQNSTYLDEKLKPHLQQVLNILIDEDLKQRESRTIGDCMEEVLRQGVIMDVCAYGQTNNPEGLFIMTLKFLIYIIQDIRSAELINHSKVHPALMQFLKFINNSIKNDLLPIGSESEEKHYILELIQTLTVKIQEDPSLVNFFFSESRNIKSKGAYIPLQILLILLIREEINESDSMKLALRSAILLHLKLNDRQILKYLVEESEICVILVIKLGNFYQSTPQETDLIANCEISELYPEDEDSKNLAWLNLLEQIGQIYPYETKQAHIEFVRFCSFINSCAISIQHSERLIDNLCSSLFNSFLMEYMQPRLIKQDKPKTIRTALQYLIQMTDIFTSSQLVEVIYYFLVGFPQEYYPVQTKLDGEEILQKQKSPFNHSRTMSIENQNSGAGSHRGSKRDSLIGDFQLRLSRINFESKNMQLNHAVNNPFMAPGSTPLFHKAAKINAVISQVLEYSQSSLDDSIIEYQSKVSPDSLIQQYNIEGHKSKQILQLLFRMLYRKEEKLSVAVLKLFDTLIQKNIPSIQKHLYLGGLQKMIQMTMYGSSGNQQNNQQQMVCLTQNSIIQAQEKFVTLFPLVSSTFSNLSNQPHQVDLLNYFNSSFSKYFESLTFFANEPKSMFPFNSSFSERSPGLNDSFSSPREEQMISNYQYFFQSDPKVTLCQFDDQILQTPKRHSPPFPITYQIPENDSEDFTVATECEEEFALQSPWENPKYHQNKQNANEGKQPSLMSQLQYMSPIGSRSVSAQQPLDDYENIEPSTFSAKGDFLREISKKMQGFLGNSVEENLILTSIFSQLCNTPVPLMADEVKLRHVQSKLTLLHIFLFECPFSFSSLHSQHLLDQGSLLPVMRQINEKVEELLQDRKFSNLVRVVRNEGNLVEQKLSNQVYKDNQQTMDFFHRNKGMIYAVAIFQEFLKEIAASLFTKELISSMIDEYEDAYLEDLKLECALEKFKDYSCTEIS